MSDGSHPLASRIVKPAKVERYQLDLGSRDGAGKARFFMRHGFHPSRPEELIAALLDHAARNPITDCYDDSWGRHYEVTGALMSPDGRHPQVRSAWFRDLDGEVRLVTAYPADPLDEAS